MECLWKIGDWERLKDLFNKYSLLIPYVRAAAPPPLPPAHLTATASAALHTAS